MTHDFVELPAFSCLGLEAEGPLRDCQDWITPLWRDFVRRARELERFSPRGRWGLMGDAHIPGAPWGGERGRYLAGWQVEPGTAPFADWKVWKVPALHWMRIPCLAEQIPQALEFAQATLRHHPEWRWEGSVHESYPRGYRDLASDPLHLMVGLQPR